MAEQAGSLDPAAVAGRRGPLSLTLVVSTAFVMDQLDGTIVANAAPSIAAALHVQATQITITMTAYIVSMAALIPLSGWVADRYGPRRVFGLAVLIFTGASGLCAVSTGLGMLVAMRVLQAVGGALMVPVGRLVVLGATHQRDLITAIAWLTWPALIAPVLAPVIAGVFTTYLSWRWIFLANLPIGAAVFGWSLRVLPRSVARPAGAGRQRLDWTGFVLGALCFGGLTYTASLLGRRVIPAVPVLVIGGIAAAAGAATLRHLRRSPHPLLSLDAFRIRTFRLAHASGSVFRLTVLGLPVLLPLYFQVALGWSPIKAGAVILCTFIGNIAVKPMTTPLLRRYGFRRVLLVSVAVMAAGIAGCALVGPGTPLVATAVLLAVGGVSRSVGFTVYNTIAFSDVPAEQRNRANTLSSTIQQLALGMGVAVGSVALRAGEALHAVIPGSALLPYRVAFVLMGLLTATALVEAVRLPSDAGENIGGASRRPARARA